MRVMHRQKMSAQEIGKPGWYESFYLKIIGIDSISTDPLHAEEPAVMAFAGIQSGERRSDSFIQKIKELPGNN